MAPPRSHEGAYIHLNALQFTALGNDDDNDNEALEQQQQCLRGKPNSTTSIRARLGITSILVLLLGGLLILLAVTLLALFWHQSMQAATINITAEPEPARYWMRIVQAGWAARLVTICTTVMRTVVALQGGLGTAMVAAILLETTGNGRGGVSLSLGPFYSLLRASKASPVTLWTATGFRPRLSSRRLYTLALAEVLATIASQFLSTMLLSDFSSQRFTQPSTSTNMPILNMTNSVGNAWWSMPPAAGWTFAELPAPAATDLVHTRPPGFVHDTGHTFRAFLPLEDAAQRTTLRRLRGPVPVMDHRVVCAAPPLVNLRLDTTLPSSATLSGQMPRVNLTDGPLVIDPNSAAPYVSFSCKLPSALFRDNKTVGETSLCVPNHRGKWTFLNNDDDPLVPSFPEPMTLFMVLDVVSTAAIIGTGPGRDRAVQTIKSGDDAGPWTMLSNGSAGVEAVCVSACLTSLATQTWTVEMSSTSDSREPRTAWDQRANSYDTEQSRLQLGVLSPNASSSPSPGTSQRGILALCPRSQWQVSHPVGDTLFFLGILVSFPIFATYGHQSNLTLDGGVVLSSRTSNVYEGTAHPAHTDLFQDTLRATMGPALALQALLARIYQMAYYEHLVKLRNSSAAGAATVAFSRTATIPVQWTGFLLGTAVVVLHLVAVVAVLVWFARATDMSFVGGDGYWQAVAQLVSDETRIVLNEADRMDDGAVRERMRREDWPGSWGDRWALQRSAGRITLGRVEKSK